MSARASHRRAAWAASTTALALLLAASPAAAQATAPQAPSSASAMDFGASAVRTTPGDQMLVQADQLVYDQENNKVTAEGHVQIYYGGNALEADRVIYDRKTGRVQAEGHVRIQQPNGSVTYADSADVTENFSKGFIQALRLESPDKTRFAAASAERVSEETTVLTRGVYTACEPCKEHPEKPPLWQVRAARIVYAKGEKMIYYRDASLEFFGFPVAWFPYLATPEPAKKRESGFLSPSFGYTSKLGAHIGTPYYFSLAPDYDLLLSPTYYSRQGLLLGTEWRQRLLDGSYNIRAAGILQQDPSAFANDSYPTYGEALGDRVARGYVNTNGKFDINPSWSWGWEGWLTSDKTFLYTYNFVPITQQDVTSQIFLTGIGDRSYFDIRAMHFFSLNPFENQDLIPVVHPVLDYNYIFDRPVFGGELGYDVNLTSLTRASSDIFQVTPTAGGQTLTFVRGIAGTDTRASLDAHWRRAIIDPLGEVWTPFASVRGDAFWLSTGNDSDLIPEALRSADRFVFRGMPTAGLEYRYPFLSAQSWGTQVLEPIVKLVASPNETKIGLLPNEDAQSLVFDDTSLFSTNRFSGFDRLEGGVRADAALSYTATLNNGAKGNVLFGQSYHIAGLNSFATPDLLFTGLYSGLDKDRSDYVGRVYLQPTKELSLATRVRLDSDTLAPQRLEIGASGNFDRLATTVTYASSKAVPTLGNFQDVEYLSSSLSYKITPEWRVSGSLSYDVLNNRVATNSAVLAYHDDCFDVSLTYSALYYNYANQVPTQSIMLTFSLRTLGGSSYKQNFGTVGTSLY